jgi:hypothetical protein
MTGMLRDIPHGAQWMGESAILVDTLASCR